MPLLIALQSQGFNIWNVDDWDRALQVLNKGGLLALVLVLTVWWITKGYPKYLASNEKIGADSKEAANISAKAMREASTEHAATMKDFIAATKAENDKLIAMFTKQHEDNLIKHDRNRDAFHKVEVVLAKKGILIKHEEE